MSVVITTTLSHNGLVNLTNYNVLLAADKYLYLVVVLTSKEAQ